MARPQPRQRRSLPPWWLWLCRQGRRYWRRGAIAVVLFGAGVAIAFFDTGLAERSRSQFSVDGLWPPVAPSLSETDFFNRNHLAAAARRIQPQVLVLGVGAPRPIDNGTTVYPQVGTGLLLGGGQGSYGVTAASVVGRGDQPIAALLADGRRVSATVRGMDPVLGIAVLALGNGHRPGSALDLGEPPQPGDWSVAIGSPAGLTRTVAIGTVSATDRGLELAGISDRQGEFIQIDAAISQGLEGGPLVNGSGAAIALMVRPPNPPEASPYGIPLAAVLRSAQQLIATGRARHGHLGLVLTPLTGDRRDALNGFLEPAELITASRGLAVVAVDPDGPAAQRLREGDVIVAMDGQPVDRLAAYREMLHRAAIAKPTEPVLPPISITLRRGDRTLTLVIAPALTRELLPPPRSS
ncbi:MAG: trypsin-like peptidase domain-containing protein [Cyanophyceae cyanobacterium]